MQLKEEHSSRTIQETKKVNIGTTEDPNLLNLGVSFSEEETLQFIDLFKEFYDVFTWSYDDLKEYDKEIFWHVIPFKEGSILVM